jgi:hypothetical protein
MRHPSRLDLIEGLNDDLARAYARVIQGRTFASVVRGTDRLVLRPLFARQIGYGISHAAMLADAIVALGEIPAARIAPVHVVDQPHHMLRTLHQAACASADAYIARRSLAELLGEQSLGLALRALEADAVAERNELELRLSEWTCDVADARPRVTPHLRVGGLAASPSDREPQPAMVGVTWPDDYRDAGSCS